MHANVRIHDHGWIAVAPDDETGFGQAVACGDILAEKRGERSLRVGGDAREKPLKLWPLFASNIHPVMIRLFRIGEFRIAKINYTRIEHDWASIGPANNTAVAQPDLTRKAITAGCQESVRAIVQWQPNDPSSATAATRRADCNCDSPPPVAAAHGWVQSQARRAPRTGRVLRQSCPC